MTRITKLLVLVLPLIGLLAEPIQGQTRQDKKAQRKKEQQVFDSTSHANAIQALKDKQWVLEANNIQNSRGRMAFVNSNVNFVMVDNDEATVQLGSPYRAGYNGLGGITLEGRINSYKMETSKKGEITVRFFVLGSGINAEVVVRMFSTANVAEAEIMPNTWGRRITYRGVILPQEESNVFKGIAR